MRTPTPIIGFVLALMLMSACAGTPAVQPTATAAPVPPTVIVTTPTPDIGAELDRMLTAWQKNPIRHYRFQLTVGCYCPMNAMMPITVEVRDGAVVSLVDANGVAVASTDPGSDFFMKYTTIDGIYTELMSARFSEADKLTLTFDPTYPVPATVSADFIAMAVDDELYLGVTAFTSLE